MNLLGHLKIRTKLASMVALAALTVFATVAVSASLSQNRMIEDRIAQMRTAVDMMVGMAQTLQDEVAAGKMTLAEAKNQFRLRGRRMTFNANQGYPIVYEAPIYRPYPAYYGHHFHGRYRFGFAHGRRGWGQRR